MILLLIIIVVLVGLVFFAKGRKVQDGSKKTNIIHDYSSVNSGSIIPNKIYKEKK